MVSTLRKGLLAFRYLLKPIGWIWVFACIPFRAYANNYIFNGVLQWGMDYLPRLWLRKPVLTGNVWELTPVTYTEPDGYKWTKVPKDPEGKPIKGYIKYREVNKVWFWVVLVFCWIWLDNGSDQDTTDAGYVNTLTGKDGYKTDGEDRTHTFTAKIFAPFLPVMPESLTAYGNTFDLGDARADYPYFHWAATFVWNLRNSTYNLKYLLG